MRYLASADALWMHGVLKIHPLRWPFDPQNIIWDLFFCRVSVNNFFVERIFFNFFNHIFLKI